MSGPTDEAGRTPWGTAGPDARADGPGAPVGPEAETVASAFGEGWDGSAGDGAPTLVEVARQRDDYLDALQHLQAEFDNYRKRVDRQQRDVIDNAATALVKKLLPVLDIADLALAHGGGEDVKQIAGGLFDVLSREGLERVIPEGEPFDPELHDAVVHEPVEGEDAPDRPEVSEVLRAGYRWKGRVLRPAMVKVRG